MAPCSVQRRAIVWVWSALMAVGLWAAAETRAQGFDLMAGSDGCKGCHVGAESMHSAGDDQVGITCVGCHGGNGSATDKKSAHVHPANKKIFSSSANPVYSMAALNLESTAFIRFMNPGDLRVADRTCGHCHGDIVRRNLMSIMAHSSMVPQAGLYNNGIHPGKIPSFGEVYMPDGSPGYVESEGKSSNLQKKSEAWLAKTSYVKKLESLPTFQMVPATDAFRVLERGNNDAGTRGPGTDFHVAGAGIVLHKTRLNDPTLWFIGTSQTRGDYRNSGCTACHVTYLNDIRPSHSGPELAEFIEAGGRPGYTNNPDKTIPRNEPGHPVRHKFTKSVPVTQCLTCHHHQGNGALGNYVGAMWWDQESDADKILEPGAKRDEHNSDAKISTHYLKNNENEHVQLEDWHGHSWNFRKVYYRDRRGNMLDKEGNKVAHDDPDRFDKAVHLKDIHFEKGMHCIDCHTERDVHGSGDMFGAMIDNIEIRCEDCHGTVTEAATLVTSGVTGGTKLEDRLRGPRTPFGKRWFQVSRGRVIQRSKMVDGLEWEVPQLVASAEPGNAKYNEKAARAHAMLKDGEVGNSKSDKSQLAHSSEKMECYTCHSSWNTQCYGCHLSAEVNRKADAIHYEKETTRAYVDYNPQVLRADAFLIGINGSSKGNKYSPMRSASAVVVTVRDRGRNTVVHQQNTISAAGFSGFAVTPNPPHTVRKEETSQCSNCHVSEANDNNAWLAATLGLGTNGTNFVGEYAYVAEGGKGFQAIKVTDGDEPQPAIGSSYHKLLDPEGFEAFVQGGRKLDTAHSAGSSNAQGIEVRGEWVYVADGKGGIRVFDRANVHNKAKAQRIVASQNSRFGQKTSIKTKDATDVALPSLNIMNVDRKSPPQNLEAPVPELFRYAFFTDRFEGLIVVDVSTFSDHDPRNNHIDRTATFNPSGQLAGATHITTGGNYAYVLSEETGLHVIDVSDPRTPRLVKTLGSPNIIAGRSLAIQFRYLFVADQQGLKVVDITDPEAATVVPGATVPLSDARDVYTMRMSTLR